ncbi:hypothetical protein BA896_003070 [Janthinobacterium lividum]|uniref:RiboL-PSP-HEPN domain-containing protein n=1 Tax=Janthinobacterium lividum TaxID=29581 RepID=A0A1E8PR65_9BURK|nr:hypothetical protein BA896_003070 [Janthinobacterium lividum]
MYLNVTFDCPCGSNCDQKVEFNRLEESDKHVDEPPDYFQSATCDECDAEFEIRISGRQDTPEIRIDGATNVEFSETGADREWANIAQRLRADDDNDYRELSWVIRSTDQLNTFESIMADVVSLVRSSIKIKNMNTLYNMAYAQVVTGVEAYLSGLFINRVVNNPLLMRRLVETDDELGKKKYSLKDIFEQYDGLKLLVAEHLQNLIFHRLDKVKPMYKSVLDVDLGEIDWLFKAVILRHDCVHRNGVDPAGKPTGIGQQEVEELVRKSAKLISRIDQEIAKTLGDLEIDTTPQRFS